MTPDDSKTSDTLKQCQYLWEEYKYRHDLIWQRIFRFTTAIVLLSIIPYLEETIARFLGPIVLIAPLLAFILTGFVLLVMRNELDLFGKIKEAYRRQQNTLLDSDLKHPRNQKSNFNLYVITYFLVLLIMTIVNGIIIWKVWL